MAKLGRNQPCHCGSGKKYKVCCLPKDEAAAAEAAEARRLAAQSSPSIPLSDDDGLDEASNHVVKLIKQGKLDEAEKEARELLVGFPYVYDGYDRLAMVARARGDSKAAAEYYRQAIAFMKENPESYDPAAEQWFRERVDQLDPVLPP